MKDFNSIKALVGEGLSEKMLLNVDCYVQKHIGLFIPSLGQCGYAAKPDHTHPSYMVTIHFTDPQKKANHYQAKIYSPDIPHSDLTDQHYYCLLIQKDFFETQYRLYANEVPCFAPLKFEMCSDVLKSLNTFAFEYSKSMPNSEITLEAQALIITHWIIRSILGENMDMRAIAADYTIARIQHYIEQHFSEKLTAEALARFAYISVSSLNRRFKAEIGQTPAQYIMSIRVEKSKTLLRRKNISLTEIAHRCGFGSSAYFSSCFLNHTGMTPSDYQSKYIG